MQVRNSVFRITALVSLPVYCPRRPDEDGPIKSDRSSLILILFTAAGIAPMAALGLGMKSLS